MRKTLLLFVLLTTLALAAGFAKKPAPAPVIGQISFLLGKESDVMLRNEGNPAWKDAKLKMAVYSGDYMRTQAESRCEIKLNDGSVVRIGEQTEFQLTEATVKKNATKVQASLTKGKLWSNIRSLKNKSDEFEVKSPTAVCAVRGTIYRMESDSTTKIGVYQGQVDVTSAAAEQQQGQQQPRQGSLQPQQIPGPTQIPPPYQVSLDTWVRLVQGYQLEVRADRKYAVSRIDTTAERSDDWVQWNQARDLQIGR